MAELEKTKSSTPPKHQIYFIITISILIVCSAALYSKMLVLEQKLSQIQSTLFAQNNNKLEIISLQDNIA